VIEKDMLPMEEIIEYCKSKFPEEACGLITIFKGRYKWNPCPNVYSGDKQSYFAIHPLAYANAADTGEVVAVVHSHTIHPSVFSRTDRAFQKKQGIPWLLVGLQSPSPELVWLEGEVEVAPLYGRKYLWRAGDCYTFVKDWYMQEWGISIPDFERDEGFWKKGQEIYLENFAKAGFVEVPRHAMQKGDVLLMQVGGNITTHGAIYLDNNVIGHHLPGRLSSKDVLGQYYLDRITKVVRHKEAMK